MSNVPYTFANNTGNIPLSELDANFSNVKASVDFAVTAGLATLATVANTVSQNAQPNINSVGTLTNLNVTGTIGAGNVAADYFIGDGSQLTNLPSLNYSNANVASYLPTYSGNLAGALISVTGNATAGNILTAGIVSVTGNATAGNILTAGIVSASGNATAGNIITAGIVSASGNVRGANLNTAGSVSASGNIIGGGIISSTGNITTNNYILGNVALASGLPSAYTDSNVVTLLSAFGSNVINTTGNVYGGNTSVAGSMSATGNIAGGNITIGGVATSGSVETINIIASDVSSGQIQGPALLSYNDAITYPPIPVDKVVLGSAGVIKYDGLEQYTINYIRITANATSANLSNTTSTNIIQANNTGYTATINFPDTYPVTEGTVVKFTVAGGNSVTLIGNAGPTVISPSFDGLVAPGTGYTYMLVNEPFISSYWARVV